MTIVIDNVVKEWGDRLFYKPVKGRKAKNIRGGRNLPKKNNLPMRIPSIRNKLSYTVSKAPEVMVKISGGGKNLRHIKAHLDYISRNGDVEIEDENGDIYHGKDEINDVRDAWGKGRVGIPIDGERRREAFNIVLSMPAGTDRQAVKNAARDFAAERFGDHQYVFAAHDDEQHPHVHLIVKSVDKSCVRMNPRKTDLQQWREHFADKLREQGIVANATPRRTRGVVRKPYQQSVRQIKKRGEISIAIAGQKADVIEEIKTGKPRENPAQQQIHNARKEVIIAYDEIVRALVKSESSEDKVLAAKIITFVKSMPQTKTLHQQAVEAVWKQQGQRHEKIQIMPENEKGR